MKKLAILFWLAAAILYAQDVNKETIKRSDLYYYGEASSINEREASDAALARLTQSIAMKVSSDFESQKIESQKNLQETVTNILKTYSSATLRNVKTIKTLVDDGVEVFHYIEKDEVNKIFLERIKLIHNIYTKAVEFENASNFGFALKWYYFATILINSIPEQNIVFNDLNLTTEVPFRINKILSNTKFCLVSDQVESEKERVLKVSVKTFDKPAQFMEFSIWDGTSQVNVQASDGEGVFKLFGSSVDFKKLDLRIKYSYYECKDEIKEVSELWDLVKRPTFNDRKQINLEDKPSTEITAKDKESTKDSSKQSTIDVLSSQKKHSIAFSPKESCFNLRLTTGDSCKVLNEIGTETVNLLELLKKKDNELIKKTFKNDPFLRDKILNLLAYNKVSIVDKSIDAEVNKTFSGWELRKIKVLNQYSSINKQASEYIILDYTPDGKLEDVNFGIIDDLYQNFVKAGQLGNDWGNRQVIIKFIEKYRTAFLSRDAATLDSIFSDDAVIIVGRVLKKTKLKDSYGYVKMSDVQPDFEQIRYTKEEYLKKQRDVFNSQKDIYLGYSTFKINRKNKQNGVYGISMRQNYQSTGYSDEGHLFLLIDFNESLPQIYVRAWQPQEWDDETIVSLSNFNINK